MYPVAIDFLSILCGLGDAFENIKIFINLTWFLHGQEVEKKSLEGHFCVSVLDTMDGKKQKRL